MYSIINYSQIKRHTIEANPVDIPYAHLECHAFYVCVTGRGQIGTKRKRGPLWASCAVPALVRKEKIEGVLT